VVASSHHDQKARIICPGFKHDSLPCQKVPCELMGRMFTSIGFVALVGALGWWQAFYGEVHRLLGATGPLPIECLYSMSSACRLVADAAELFGARSYHPLIFWLACGCLLIALGLGPRGRVPRRRSRNGAKPRPR
jgi:hypothetical protein